MLTRLKPLAVPGLLSLTVAILLFVRFHPGTRSAVNDFFSPFLKAEKNVEHRIEGRADRYTKTKPELVREIRELEIQLAHTALEIPRLQQLERENEELRDLLQMERMPAFDYRAARVLFRDKATGDRILRIDHGTEHGIAVGQPVLAGGVLLGRVLETSRHTARVMALIDPNCEVSARISGTELGGILSGATETKWRSRPTYLLKHLPRDETYRVGDRVETSPFCTFAPPGIPIGVIGSADDEVTAGGRDNLLYKSVRVRPAYTEAPFTFVTVLIPARTTISERR